MYVTHGESIGAQTRDPLHLKVTGGKASDAVDISALAALEGAQVEGEPDLVVELIDLYLKDSADKLAAMREAIAETDGASLRRATHGLRGSSASLGAHRVAALCLELEQTDFSGSPEGIEKLRITLEQECELVRQVFAAERRRRRECGLRIAECGFSVG